MPARTVSSSHIAILQLGVSIWNQWRANEPLTRPNLRNADLSGCHLENVNLCRADLRGANLSSAYLYEADFQAADLRQANLTRAGLIGSNFHRANLAGACLHQAYLSQSDLSNASFVRSNLKSADLQGALLTRTKLANASIEEADLSHSFDLSAAQLASTEDAQLAYFSDTLRIQLGLPPKSLESEILITQEPSDDAIADSGASDTSETVRQRIEKLNSSPLRSGSRPVEVFQPARKGTASQPALRRLVL